MKIFTIIRHISRKSILTVSAFLLSTVSIFAADSMTGTVKFSEDFGTSSDPSSVYSSFNAAGLSSFNVIGTTYTGTTSPSNPNNYCITPRLSNLSNDIFYYWTRTLTDHTGGKYGNMLVVDGSKTAGILFKRTVTGLCQDAEFEGSLWYAYIHRTDRTQSMMPIFQFEVWSGTPITELSATDAAALTIGENYSSQGGSTLLAIKKITISATTVDALVKSCQSDSFASPSKKVYTYSPAYQVYKYKDPSGDSIFICNDGSGKYYQAIAPNFVTKSKSYGRFTVGSQILSTTNFNLTTSVGHTTTTSYPVYSDGTHHIFLSGGNYYITTLSDDGTTYNESGLITTDNQVIDLTSVLNENFKYTGLDENKMWQKLSFSFTLPDQDYCTFVIRNYNASGSGNDFAIDDISFCSYTPFDMNVNISTASSNTACSDGIITLTSVLSGPANTTQLQKEIMNYGFYFQGGKINASGDTIWTRLGSETPLQIMSLSDKLEVNLTVNQYNYYDCYRLAVASEPANLNTDCVSFSTKPLSRGDAVVSPDYSVSGDDICIESSDATKTGTAKYVLKAVSGSLCGTGCTGWWSAKVRLSNGTIKTITSTTKCGE